MQAHPQAYLCQEFHILKRGSSFLHVFSFFFFSATHKRRQSTAWLLENAGLICQRNIIQRSPGSGATTSRPPHFAVGSQCLHDLSYELAMNKHHLE